MCQLQTFNLLLLKIPASFAVQRRMYVSNMGGVDLWKNLRRRKWYNLQFFRESLNFYQVTSLILTRLASQVLIGPQTIPGWCSSWNDVQFNPISISHGPSHFSVNGMSLSHTKLCGRLLVIQGLLSKPVLSCLRPALLTVANCLRSSDKFLNITKKKF